jgi:hypothetical protein
MIGYIVGTALVIVGAMVTGPTAIASAENTNTASDLSGLATVEEYALATNGSYSSNLLALTSGEYSYQVKLTEGTRVGVTVDPATGEYLLVGLSAAGDYIYRGSTHTNSVEGGTTFDPVIAAKVTDSAYLANAAPTLTDYVGSQIVEASK